MITNKLVIFDYDGVIADSLGVWIEAFDIAGRKNSIPYRLDAEKISMLEHITFAAVLEQAGLTDDALTEKYVSDILDLLSSGSGGVDFFTGASALVEKLSRAGNIICINTANHTPIVRKKLHDEKILPFVTDIAGGDIKGSKSEKINIFMKKYSFKPENTFMIGDSLGDITEGKKSGVITIAAAYGWQKGEKLLEGNPDYFCSNLSEMEKVFNSLA